MLLLKNADLWDPAPVGRRDVLVGGDRVLAIGRELGVGALDVDVIDLGGRVLCPGLVDCHVHLTGGGGEGGAHTRVPPLMPTQLSRAGITTAIGLLGTDGSTRTIAELLATARGIEHYGPTCLCYTGSYELPPVTLTGSVRGDIVHVDRIVAVGEVALSDHRSSQPTYEELLRLAADAHVAGMMTGKAGLLHLHLGDGARGLGAVRRALAETELPARVFHPTHCNRNAALWGEALALGAGGGVVDVTAFPPDESGAPSAADAVAGWLAQGLDPTRITCSSDAGGCLPEFTPDGELLRMGVGDGGGLLDTVRDLVRRGVSLEQALAPVTRNVAALFRLSDKGRVRVGGHADLLVLDGELAVDGVVARGRVLVRGGAPVIRGVFEG